MTDGFGSLLFDRAEAACAPVAGMPVIALHCSGADGRQWRKLADTVSSQRNLIAVECYGCESTGHWPGDHAFTLADEAHRVIDLIDRLGTQAHLVGHSYGGGVALRVAVERPHAIASLALYEPSAFHLLTQLGPSGFAAREEVLRLIQAVSYGVLSGDYQTAISKRTAALAPQSTARFSRIDRGTHAACCLSAARRADPGAARGAGAGAEPTHCGRSRPCHALCAPGSDRGRRAHGAVQSRRRGQCGHSRAYEMGWRSGGRLRRAPVPEHSSPSRPNRRLTSPLCL